MKTYSFRLVSLTVTLTMLLMPLSTMATNVRAAPTDNLSPPSESMENVLPPWAQPASRQPQETPPPPTGLPLTGESGELTPDATEVESSPNTREAAPPPPDCAILDDPVKRGLMSGMLETHLLIACGRENELGMVESRSLALPPSMPQAMGTDVLVNDPTGETHPSATQSETSLARNKNTGVLCSTYNDAWSGVMLGTGFTGFSHSDDDGATWVDHGPVGINSGGDPANVWRRADGHFYHASLHTNGLGLWDLGTGCTSSTFVGMIHTGFSDDKELMAVDNNPVSPYYGRLYVAWTDFTDSHIYVTTSDNAGASWSAPVDISGKANVQGAWPAVDPVTNDVYVGWVHWDVYPDGPIDIEVVRSVNGGGAWGYVTNPADNVTNPRDATATTNCGRPALNGNIRYLPSPQIVVDRNSNLHIVYSYDPDGYATGDVINVYYRRSTDQGATWESEIQLNDDFSGTDQWFPALAVADDGTVGTFWYDRRLDSASNYMFNYYKTVSYDNGVTFQANERVSDQSSPVDLDPNLNTCYHGDYDTSVAGNGRFYIQWSADLRGDADIYLDTEPFTLDKIVGTVYDVTDLRGLEGARVKATLQPTGTFYFGNAGVGGYYEVYASSGAYSVTATAYGYQSNTVTAIVASDAQADIPLTSVPFYLVDGTVYDADTGYPVSAHITVTGDPFGPPPPDNETWSDPFTGDYGLTLSSLITYTFFVEAVGYGTITRTVGPLTGDAVEDFALYADLDACTAPGYGRIGPLTPYFFDDFESGYGNWGGTGLWNPESEADTCGAMVAPFPSSSNAVYYGLGGTCTYSTGVTTTGELYMAFDVGLGNLSGTLTFESYEETECGGANCGVDERYVDVSTDGGNNWTNVWGSGGPEGTWYQPGPPSVDLSPYANEPVRARFRFDSVNAAANDYFGWMVDDVLIESNACVPILGDAILVPARITADGCSGEPQVHELTFVNHTGIDDVVLVSYITSPGATVLDIPATLGVVPDGGVQTFNAEVKITESIRPSTTVYVTVTAYLSSTPAFSDIMVIEKHAVLGRWEPRTNSPGPSMDGAVIEYGGKIYNVGGYTGVPGAEDVDIYDPITDSWTTGTPGPGGIDYPVDACFGYDGGGDPVILLLPDARGVVTNTWHRYNIAANSWDTPTLPAPLPANGIWAHDIVVDRANNVCYITGGATAPGGGDLTTLYEYHPDSNTATLLGNFTHIPGGFDFHAGWFAPWIGTAGGVCVGGGVDSASIVYADTQCYDIAAATFNPPNTDLGPLPEPWWGMADMEKEHAGAPQLWLANGTDAASLLLQRSAYFSPGSAGFTYGPDPIYAVYRVEGDSQLGDIHVVDGSTGGFASSALHEQFIQCPGSACRLDVEKSGPEWAYPDDVVPYAITVKTPGWFAGTPFVRDRLPAGVQFAGGLTATYGTAWYSPTANAVYWSDPSLPLMAADPVHPVTPAGPPAPPVEDATSLSDLLLHPTAPSAVAPGDILENFPNTWWFSTVGLVYDPAADSVRYAHEFGPGTTIHDVDYPVPHPLLGSLSLSAINPGWPPTLDDRDGAGYDAATGTYFLPDYNGDLAIRDDNIVEIDAAGAILNAWEIDGAGNDSYDGSAINQIIDIAVVPGSPTRYFAAAADVSSVMYEIDLIKAGRFITDTWGTVGICTVPGLGDNWGIDYDANNGLLYHSDSTSTNIVVTDLGCNVLDAFTCPSPAGFNTGVTSIEGSWPPEVWVTDFGSNSTTRCRAFQPAPTAINITFDVTVTAPVSTWVANTAVLESEYEISDPMSGTLYYSQDGNSNGLYTLDTNTGAGTYRGASGVATSTVGLAPGDNRGELFGSRPAGLLRIATDGGGATVYGSQNIEGLAYNQGTGMLYGQLDGDFFELDPTTGLTLTNLTDPGFDAEGLAADPVNNLVYGIGDNTRLVVYDVPGDSWSTIGDTGLNWNDAGLAYDPASQVLYAVSDNQGSNLYRIDPATAVPTLIGATGIGGTANGGLGFVANNSILHIRTADTISSVQRALNELGYGYDVFNGSDWTGIDFVPYDVVIIGMDGGSVTQPSLQKIRTDAIGQGKRVIFVGGTAWQNFVLGVDQYLLLNETSNYFWTISGSPQFTLVNPGHPLAQGLPASYDFVNSDAGYYMLRATDPTLDVVAVNGDGYDSLFYKRYGCGDGDLIWFTYSAYNDYWLNQPDYDVLKQIIANALTYPIQVSGSTHEFHVHQPPDLTWIKDVYVNGTWVGEPEDGPFTVVPNDTVQIVDRLTYTGTFPLFATIGEDWGGYPLALQDELHTAGAVVCGSGGCDWGVTLLPGADEKLVKTFRVTDTVTVAITEWLAPDGMMAYSRTVVLEPPQFTKDGPAVAYPDDVFSYTIVFNTQNGIVGTALMSDTLPLGVAFADALTVTYGTAWYSDTDNAIYWTNTTTPTLASLLGESAAPVSTSSSTSPELAGASCGTSAPSSVGPLSVRSAERYATLAATGLKAPLAPSATWFNASPLPPGDGIVRYAHAQCPGETNRFYVISGRDESFSLTANTWRYDADTDTWTPLAPFPAPVEGPSAVCYAGHIYVAGGDGTDQFYIYDIVHDAWSAGAALPRYVWGAAMGVWDGQVYMIGGDSDFFFGGTSDEVNVYDIATDSWIVTGTSMPTATVTSGWVQAGQYLYIVGGWGDNSPTGNVTATQRYDMASDTWEIGPIFTSARADFALAITEQNLYAVGGDADGGTAFNAVTTTEALDLSAWPGGTWTDVGDPLPVALSAHKGGFCTEAMAGGEVWSVGGLGTALSFITSTNQYRPSEGCLGIPNAVTVTFNVTVTAEASGTVINTAEMNYNGTLFSADTAFDVPRPDIVVDPTALTVILNPNDVLTRTLFIENVGTSDLVWGLSENPAQTWLSENPTGGTTVPASATPVDVVFDATGLSDGVYTTTLEIASNDPDESTVDVSVVLTVTSACIPVSGASFVYSPASPDAGETITFTGNVAQGTLPITYTWNFGDDSTGSGQMVAHTYTLSDTYTVVMTVTNPCPSQDAATQAVVVTGEPDIAVNPLALSAILNPGNAVTRTLTINNDAAATANLAWNLAESPAQTWLSESPTGGDLPPAGSTPVDVVFDATGVVDGVYTTTLQITSNDPDESTVDVSVVLTVTSACIPVAGADFVYAPLAPIVSEIMTFTSSVAQGTLPITYTWDFGDDSTGNGRIVTHTYALSDTYSVVVTATNACPSQDVATRDIAVIGSSRAIYLPVVMRNYGP